MTGEMVLIVHGFPNKFAALQFEWAWQNPHLSRHFKASAPGSYTSSRKDKLLEAKLMVLVDMLHLDQWCRWPLRIHVNSSDVYELLLSLPQPPDHMNVTEGTLSQLPLYQPSNHIRENDEQLDGDISCSLCSKAIEISKPELWLRCIHSTCNMVSHLLCLSESFLKEERLKDLSFGPNYQTPTRNELIPIAGSCPDCSSQLLWGDLIQDMKMRIKGGWGTQHISSEESSSEEEEEVSSDDGQYEDVELNDVVSKMNKVKLFTSMIDLSMEGIVHGVTPIQTFLPPDTAIPGAISADAPVKKKRKRYPKKKTMGPDVDAGAPSISTEMLIPNVETNPANMSTAPAADVAASSIAVDDQSVLQKMKKPRKPRMKKPKPVQLNIQMSSAEFASAVQPQTTYAVKTEVIVPTLVALEQHNAVKANTNAQATIQNVNASLPLTTSLPPSGLQTQQTATFAVPAPKPPARKRAKKLVPSSAVPGLPSSVHENVITYGNEEIYPPHQFLQYNDEPLSNNLAFLQYPLAKYLVDLEKEIMSTMDNTMLSLQELAKDPSEEQMERDEQEFQKFMKSVLNDKDFEAVQPNKNQTQNDLFLHLFNTDVTQVLGANQQPIKTPVHSPRPVPTSNDGPRKDPKPSYCPSKTNKRYEDKKSK
ncbi:hypothetical protein HDV05_005339 [Chytridiales sp. JEL 0842]|nr:hypothetical protein HDV05_005339 [Chytridiales sp. JEL 0842]